MDRIKGLFRPTGSAISPCFVAAGRNPVRPSRAMDLGRSAVRPTRRAERTTPCSAADASNRDEPRTAGSLEEATQECSEVAGRSPACPHGTVDRARIDASTKGRPAWALNSRLAVGAWERFLQELGVLIAAVHANDEQACGASGLTRVQAPGVGFDRCKRDAHPGRRRVPERHRGHVRPDAGGLRAAGRTSRPRRALAGKRQLLASIFHGIRSATWSGNTEVPCL